MANELIERLEAATGPDRELDAVIAVLVDWRFPDWEEGDLTPKGMADKNGMQWLVDRMENSWTSMWRHIPTFTASIDAALTLVPEGWGYTLCTQPPDHKPWASVVEWRPDDKGKMWTGNHMARSGEVKARTPALAICIAALRAKDSQ